MIKRNKHTILYISFFISTLFLCLVLTRSELVYTIIDWGKENEKTYLLILILVKILGIVWPPLPGGLITLGSIPVIGWEYSFFADTIGSILGSSISYVLGRIYGYRILDKIFDANTIAYIKKIKLKSKRELEAVIMTRFAFNFLSEFVSYLSGIIKIKFSNFITGVIFSSVLSFPAFYFANNIFSGKNVLSSLLFLIVFVFIIYKFKGRYFE